MIRRTLLAAMFLGVTVYPATLTAQVAPAPFAPAPAPAPRAAATEEPGVVPQALLAARLGEGAPGLQAARTTSLAPILAPAMAVAGRREGGTLMIVGGAAILLGAAMDEEAIALIGAGVGLYGLYLYIR